ncbi:MAG: hypothetical protein JSV44_02925 [Candidatus Zixiibacteriota bacterium]|nr:MAG: hypothetical protein JSV44_02925 [candidate division Zixibacteria bacterium]
MQWFKTTRRTLVYSFVLLVIGFFNVIPRKLAVFIAAAAGQIAYLLLAKDRIKAERNLTYAYGDRLSPGQRRVIVRNLFANFGRNAADVVRLRRHYHNEIKSLVDVEGMPHFERAYKRGKGVVAITGHIGNFELLAAFFVSLGYRAAAIGRELYDKRLNRLLAGNREALGLVTIDTRDSPRKMFRFLKEGHVLGVLMDTDSFRVRSIFVPAFGRLSHTPVGQSILGLRSGAAFVPLACVRNGSRYKIVIKPEIIIERSDDFEKDVYNITRKCTEALEDIIDDYKDQWIWVHNRWHNRPEKSIPDYRG